MADETAYDPLDYTNLGESVAGALLARPVVPLGGLARFGGAGIYAIYYTGDFPVYQTLVASNLEGRFESPIYVGKAVPAGARKGGRGVGATGTALFNRLNEHAKSIGEATNLDLADFYCRYLVVKDIWIPLGEALLIELKQPLWNIIIDGFGNHDPGTGRLQGRRSLWDTIHPGRRWTAKLPPNEHLEHEVLEIIRRAFAGEPVQKLLEDAQTEEAESDGQ